MHHTCLQTNRQTDRQASRNTHTDIHIILSFIPLLLSSRIPLDNIYLIITVYVFCFHMCLPDVFVVGGRCFIGPPPVCVSRWKELRGSLAHLTRMWMKVDEDVRCEWRMWMVVDVCVWV